MKIFQFKIKSYDNEEGEYTDWQQAESGTIIQFILQHWFNETLPNNLDVVVIKNEKGDQLVLDHERKDVFRYFFIPIKLGRTYYYKMTDITFMFFTLESFFNGLNDDLINNLNKTTDDWRWVKHEFIGKNFLFQISNWKLIKHFTGLFIASMVWLFVLPILIYKDDVVLRIVLGVILLVLGLYGIRLRNKIIWYLDQKNLKIILSRGDRFIHIIINGIKKSIPKSDIVSIHQFEESGDDLTVPIFTEIVFQNGCVLNITDLIMTQYLISDKFHAEQHLFNTSVKLMVALRKRTNLSLYFPEIKSRTYLRN